MSFDLAYLQIPIFTGINDQPVEPVANKAGNGAHLINQFNQLIDDVTANLNDLESAINTSGNSQSFVIYTDVFSYQANANQHIIVAGNGIDGRLIIRLPDNPNSGDKVLVIKTDSGDTVEISNYGTFCAAQVNRITLTERFKLVSFIYVDPRMGWITDNREYLNEEVAIS